MCQEAPFKPIRKILPEKNFKRYAMYTFFILFTVTTLRALDTSLFTSAINVIGKELHLGISDIGILASAFTISLTLGIIPIGIWADRVKRKHVIAFCLVIWSLATLCTGLVTGFLTLFLARTFVGTGESGYNPAKDALVGDFFGEASRAKVLSWLAVSNIVGTVLGLIIGGFTAGLSPGSWRLAFLFTGLAGLLLFFAVWRMSEPERRKIDEKREKVQFSFRQSVHQLLSRFGTLFGIKTLRVLIAVEILEAFALTALTTYASILIQQKDTFGLSSGQAGLFLGLILASAGLPGILLGGYLSDWLNRRYQGARLLVCSVSLLLAVPFSLAMILSINVHNFGLFAACLFGTILVDSAHAGSLGAARLDVVPSEMRASAVAIAVTMQNILGSALAPIVVGPLARSFDPGGQHFLQALAGHDLMLALALTCPVAFLAAGIVASVGLRWVHHDKAMAQLISREIGDSL